MWKRVEITDVEKGSQAEKLGFIPGDTIFKLNNILISEKNDFKNELMNSKNIDIGELVVLRNKEEIVFEVDFKKPIGFLYREIDADSNSENEHASKEISVLRIFAWLDLIGSIIASIFIWSKFGTRKMPGFSYLTEADPLTIGLGFGILVQGVFACVLFLVIASMAENLIAIRKNTKQE
jgi:hypothetical protein